MSKMARASYSRLAYYNNCQYAYKLKYIDKVPPLDGPVQKDRQGNIKPPAWQRGSVIHQAMDDYINGKEERLLPELYDLRTEIDDARKLKTEYPDRVLTEQNKYFDTDFNLIDMDKLSEEEKTVTSGGDPCPLEYHALIIIDLLIFNEDFKHATIIDLKSGKEHPVKHGSQTQMYALFTSLEYPEVKNFTTQLWYCDQSGKITQRMYSKHDIQAYFNFWNTRISAMANDEAFYSRPSETACMFCEYGPEKHSNKWVNKTGTCSEGMDKRYRI